MHRTERCIADLEASEQDSLRIVLLKDDETDAEALLSVGVADALRVVFISPLDERL